MNETQPIRIEKVKEIALELVRFIAEKKSDFVIIRLR